MFVNTDGMVRIMRMDVDWYSHSDHVMVVVMDDPHHGIVVVYV